MGVGNYVKLSDVLDTWVSPLLIAVWMFFSGNCRYSVSDETPAAWLTHLSLISARVRLYWIIWSHTSQNRHNLLSVTDIQKHSVTQICFVQKYIVQLNTEDCNCWIVEIVWQMSCSVGSKWSMSDLWRSYRTSTVTFDKLCVKPLSLSRVWVRFLIEIPVGRKFTKFLWVRPSLAWYSKYKPPEYRSSLKC